jgi:hypothetical protein
MIFDGNDFKVNVLTINYNIQNKQNDKAYTKLKVQSIVFDRPNLLMFKHIGIFGILTGTDFYRQKV